jgi:uncharacterized membrane protein (UPF0127 family)
MKSRHALAALPAAILLALVSGPAASLEPSHLVTDFPRSQVLLETAGPRCLLVDVYVARSAEQRAQGLMFVEALPEFEGMYFGYISPVEAIMWMKNTLLPLDMVFIREDHTVGRVARDTPPLSTARISSGGPVVGVLELNAGFAQRWRVEPGTRLVLL